jgi:hypothetical protein
MTDVPCQFAIKEHVAKIARDLKCPVSKDKKPTLSNLSVGLYTGGLKASEVKIVWKEYS